jgi:hypothetical protein
MVNMVAVEDVTTACFDLTEFIIKMPASITKLTAITATSAKPIAPVCRADPLEIMLGL